MRSLADSIARIVAICVKEVTQLRRDRLTFAMVVVIPLMQLLMFGYSINTKVRNIPIGVCDHSNSSFSRQLVEDVQASQVVVVVTRPIAVTVYVLTLQRGQTIGDRSEIGIGGGRDDGAFGIGDEYQVVQTVVPSSPGASKMIDAGRPAA